MEIFNRQFLVKLGLIVVIASAGYFLATYFAGIWTVDYMQTLNANNSDSTKDLVAEIKEPTENKEIENEECNVVRIELHGLMSTTPAKKGVFDDWEGEVSSDEILTGLRDTYKDKKIKGIILSVNSTGGEPIAGEEVALALKKMNVPTVASIRQYGDSAAYLAATGADKIFAYENSDVGSVGVTTSYLDNSEKNKKEGIRYVELVAGKYKDMLSPDRPLTAEEQKLIERDLKITHENFIKMVAENRNLPIEKVRALADGSSMMGLAAKEKGLVDEIGSIFDAQEYISNLIGEPVEECIL